MKKISIYFKSNPCLPYVYYSEDAYWEGINETTTHYYIELYNESKDWTRVIEISKEDVLMIDIFTG